MFSSNKFHLTCRYEKQDKGSWGGAVRWKRHMPEVKSFKSDINSSFFFYLKWLKHFQSTVEIGLTKKYIFSQHLPSSTPRDGWLLLDHRRNHLQLIAPSPLCKGLHHTSMRSSLSTQQPTEKRMQKPGWSTQVSHTVTNKMPNISAWWFKAQYIEVIKYPELADQKCLALMILTSYFSPKLKQLTQCYRQTSQAKDQKHHSLPKNCPASKKQPKKLFLFSNMGVISNYILQHRCVSDSAGTSS